MLRKHWLIFLFAVIIILAGIFNYSYQRSEYVQYTSYLPTYDLDKFPPKVLVYSGLTPKYINDHADELAKEGFDGVIQTQLDTGWPGNPKKLQAVSAVVLESNRKANKAGLKYNFLKIGLDQGRLGNWDDEKLWQEQLSELTETCAWAKKVGYRGIALDTEAYHNELFHNGVARNNRIPNVRKLFKRRGYETTKAMIKGFPDAELIVFDVGHLYAYTKREPNKYAYWIDYFNGMLNAKPPKGIDLLAERTYKVWEPWRLKDYYYDIQGEIIADNVDDPRYWLEKCSIGLGMWPLGREYWDKRANLTAWQFKQQFNSSIQYCPKYVWIYAHGQGWWQVPDGAKYGFNPKETDLPVVKDIAKYREVLQSAKRQDLLIYYKEIKYHKVYKYLDLWLEKVKLWRKSFDK